MKIKTILTIALLWMVASLFVITQAQTVLEYWHSHDTTEALVQTFADEFNASQSDYRVIPRMTGSYQESAIKLVAALGSNSAPVSPNTCLRLTVLDLCIQLGSSTRRWMARRSGRAPS